MGKMTINIWAIATVKVFSEEEKTNHMCSGRNHMKVEKAMVAIFNISDQMRRSLVSFSNPLASGSGLVERTPIKVGI